MSFSRRHVFLGKMIRHATSPKSLSSCSILKITCFIYIYIFLYMFLYMCIYIYVHIYMSFFVYTHTHTQAIKQGFKS